MLCNIAGSELGGKKGRMPIGQHCPPFNTARVHAIVFLSTFDRWIFKKEKKCVNWLQILKRMEFEFDGEEKLI